MDKSRQKKRWKKPILYYIGTQGARKRDGKQNLSATSSFMYCRYKTHVFRKVLENFFLSNFFPGQENTNIIISRHQEKRWKFLQFLFNFCSYFAFYTKLFLERCQKLMSRHNNSICKLHPWGTYFVSRCYRKDTVNEHAFQYLIMHNIQMFKYLLFRIFRLKSKDKTACSQKYISFIKILNDLIENANIYFNFFYSF